jgi:hypothetical protein
MVAVMLAVSGPAWAAASGDQVKRNIEARFPVQVLKIRETTVDGRAAFVVTVMNQGGAFNEAFQVNTLVVSAETGKLMPQFRHRASGYELPGAVRHEPSREGTEAPR